jgi:hypothetical protein
MTSQSVALRNHRFQNGVLACMVTATRTVKACTRKAAGSKWWLLLSIGAGMLLTVVALKLVALFGAAVNVSFLRDVGQNVDLPAAWGGLPAALAAFFGWPAGNDPYPFRTPDDKGIPYSIWKDPPLSVRLWVLWNVPQQGEGGYNYDVKVDEGGRWSVTRTLDPSRFQNDGNVRGG